MSNDYQHGNMGKRICNKKNENKHFQIKMYNFSNNAAYVFLNGCAT